jgi:hypothetical protein
MGWALQPVMRRRSVQETKEKADVVEHPEAFDHVGLLFD